MRIKERVGEQLREVSDSLGIQLSLAELPKSDDFEYEIRIVGIDRPYGFAFKLGVDYLCWTLSLHLDEYGSSALEAMRTRFGERRGTLESIVKIANERNQALVLKINDMETSSWTDSQNWSDLELQLRHSYSSEESAAEALRTALLDALCIVLSLLVESEVWDKDNNNEEPELGALEGDQSSILVNKYERSRYNRALCLRYYGFNCRGCGIHMEAKYGPIGQNVIHVHHIVPLSLMGGSYRLNPIKDLIPLCPNCHNVVHRVTPPLSIADLNAQTGFEGIY